MRETSSDLTIGQGRDKICEGIVVFSSGFPFCTNSYVS
jgi:hypothetical protein